MKEKQSLGGERRPLRNLVLADGIEFFELQLIRDSLN